MQTFRYGFLGAGKMASALVKGILQSGAASPAELIVFDTSPAQVEHLTSTHGVAAAATAGELAQVAEAVILCVKPQDAAGALASVGSGFKDRVLVSIAAGLSLDWLHQQTSPDAKIARAMPNTAAEIQQSATALCFSESVTGPERAAVLKAFAAVGEVFELAEKFFDAVVGVSGSGPAYACLLVEAMSDGGTRAGLPREIATRLAALTVRGAASLILQTGQHPALLREAVSSPAGTTLAALAELEAGAVRSHVAAAVAAAARRSKELSQG
jgi:pyrroline-5-carboxylate reductase